MKYFFTFLMSLLILLNSSAQINTPPSSFTIFPLGVKGGLDESNLSAYMITATGTDGYICMDAGTLHTGLEKLANANFFNGNNAEEIQKKYIKAYFISHAHLDHLAGLILNSPNDLANPIYALPSVLEVIKNNYFTWKSWANFGSEGDPPILNKYNDQALSEGKEISIPNTGLTVTTFILSHVKPYESTAFLVGHKNNYVLYLGDTGADEVEQSNQLEKLWMAVAEKIKAGQLKALFIEVSFDNAMPDKSLFGHLTPKLLMQELTILNHQSAGLLKNTPIYVTHIKPCANCEANIKKEIAEANTLGLSILYPEQGKPIELK